MFFLIFFAHIGNLLALFLAFVNLCKNIKSPCILHSELCQLPCFFLFIKTFQAAKTFYLLMSGMGKLMTQSPDPPRCLFLTMHGSSSTPCHLISLMGFSTHMQTDLRSSLGLITSDILGQRLSLESGIVSRAKFINISDIRLG